MLDRFVKYIETENDIPGNLHDDHKDIDGKLVKGDGITCDRCRNRGFFTVLSIENGEPQTMISKCSCLNQRNNIAKLRNAGLEKLARRHRLDNFETVEKWQKGFLNNIKDYIEYGAKEGNWLYVGGNTGAGKTHLCTAVIIELMKEHDGKYIVWPIEAQRIKSLVTDAIGYAEEIGKLQKAEILYIDDFFKPIFNANGFEVAITKADVSLAYNIIIHRYNNDLLTIFSSELFSSELAMIDSSIAGRIAEMCGKYKIDIGRDESRNYRLKQHALI